MAEKTKENTTKTRRRSLRANVPGTRIAQEFTDFNLHRMYPYKWEGNKIVTMCRSCGYSLKIKFAKDGSEMTMSGSAMKFPCPVATGGTWSLPSLTDPSSLSRVPIEKDMTVRAMEEDGETIGEIKIVIDSESTTEQDVQETEHEEALAL